MSGPPVLLAAKRLHPDAASEGICTSRALHAMVDAGLDARVVTSDEASDAAGLRRALPWFTGPIDHVTTLPRRPVRGLRRRAWSAIDLAGTWVDGHPTWYRHSVSAWRHALERALATHRPQVIVTRGAGGGFEPHLAMVDLDPDVPWIAHYHDPWPAIRWPAPYRPASTRALRRQEAGHERVLARADALTFPSARLRDWVVGGSPELEAKAHVVPHVIGPPTPPAGADPALVATVGERPFTLVHTGTLLRHRRVGALVDAVAAFSERDEERRAATRLVLIGPADPAAFAGGGTDPASLEVDGRLVRAAARVDQASALGVAAAATADVLVEAPSDESPFFPGKLADYAGLGRPVLALTPRESVASDLMGEAHPLRVDPDDREAIEGALEVLWDAHRHGRLDELRLPTAGLGPLAPDIVGARLAELVRDLTGAPTTPAGSGS